MIDAQIQELLSTLNCRLDSSYEKQFNRSGKFTGSCKIEVPSREEELRLIQLSGTLFHGRKLVIQSFVSQPSEQKKKQTQPQNPLKQSMVEKEDDISEFGKPSHTIFVTNLPIQDIKELNQIFSELGQVRHIRVQFHHQSGAFQRCAFVQFKDNESAAKAVKWNQQKQVGDSIIRVVYARTQKKKKKKKSTLR
eukprot:TRINITY_DN5115_c0_g1_i2.p1 TRINITY_DN5115_c0_g1~~TRINITY_DN5115_c0_g1_i2.p1  ORF type:complete len:193 (+),score=46.90 TRINITY_DN5115_c0_g1_i2:296-874(+)